MPPTLLERARQSRDVASEAAQKILDEAELRHNELRGEAEKLEGETRAAKLAEADKVVDDAVERSAALKGEIDEWNERVAHFETVEQARSAASDASRGESAAVVRSEPLTYNRSKARAGKAQTSYFRDLWQHKNGDPNATARLARHAAEMEVEMPARVQRREENAEQQVRSQIGWDAPNPFERHMEQRVNPNRTDGQGGYLIPPVWLMDDLIKILRAGRVTADRMRQMDLPEGTDSINIPKLSTGTTAAVQTADAAGVSSTDFTDTSVSAGVKTIAGQQDIAIQLLEQSPLPVDEILFEDLIADYNKKLNLQVLAGSNASGQLEGLYSSAGASPWTGYNTIAYTDASPTAGELFSPLAAALSQIEQNRFDLENVEFFMHSRRWFWMVGSADSNNRPIVLPKGQAHYNAMAEAANPQTPPGYKGELALGFSVYTDPLITTSDTAGAGTGQDIIIAIKTDDAWLFEGEMRQRSLPEVLSGTLQVRFQIYNYMAFLLRYAQSLAIISGTGLSAPSGF